ncbi:MAG: hypothetical protein U5L96_13050 [Owenweeksia sp.]|nr:hypothetical protein [Owenweeksia sp.]
MAHVRQQALDILNQKSEKDQKSVLEQDGLRIYTTLNAKMQGYAQAAVRKHMAGLQKIFDRHWQGRSAWKEHPEVFENELKRSSSYKNLESRRLSVRFHKLLLE